MDVWIIESGDYSQRSVDGVALSPEGAIAFIKGRYPPPYIVEWEEPIPDGDDCSLTGHFAQVPHYSTHHDCTFDITRWPCASDPAREA